MKIWTSFLNSSFFILILVSMSYPETNPRISKTPAEYWRSTPLDFKFVGRYLNDRCYESAKNLIACVQALDELAGAVAPEGAVIATVGEALVEPSRIGKRILSFGPVGLYEKLPNSEKSPRAFWKEQQKVQALQIRAIQKLYEDQKASRIELNEVLASLRPKVLLGDLDSSEAWAASLVMNKYFASAEDPHTHIDSYQQMVDEQSGEGESFFGIGVNFRDMESKLMVAGVIQGGPADEAGIQVGDQIVAVDDVNRAGKKLPEVIKLIKGPEHTSVKLTVRRKVKTLDILVDRRLVEIKNVVSRMLNDVSLPLGYIKLNSFVDDTACQRIYDATAQFEKSGAKGLVLDLRGNGGGTLETSVCIGALFVGKQPIVTMKDLTTGEKKTYLQDIRVPISRLPMVTLMDAGSASASEILAGALQDYQRSFILGERSFGKATVQRSETFLQDKSNPAEPASVIKFNTVARFYQPSGRTNQLVGILPDFEVHTVPHATDEQTFAVREAELYSNAKSAEGKSWVNPRPLALKNIRSCIDREKLAESLYEAHKNDVSPGDFQLLSAEEVLRCQLRE